MHSVRCSELRLLTALILLGFTGSDGQSVLKLDPDDNPYPAEKRVYTEISEGFEKLKSLGFFNLNTDSVSEDTIFVSTGKRFSITSISDTCSDSSTSGRVLSDISLPAPYSEGFIDQVIHQILSHYENTGHPFAEINREIEIDRSRHTVGITLNTDKGPYTIIEGFEIDPGDLDTGLVETAWSLKPGTPYSAGDIKQAEEILRSEDWISNVYIEGPEIHDSKTENNADTVHALLFIKTESVSNFFAQGTAGFSGRGKLSGIFDITSENMFKRGEYMELGYRARKDYNNLRFSADIPYVFNSPFSSSTSFLMELEDSSGIIRGETHILFSPGPIFITGLGVSGRELTEPGSSANRYIGFILSITKRHKEFRSGILSAGFHVNTEYSFNTSKEKEERILKASLRGEGQIPLFSAFAFKPGLYTGVITTRGRDRIPELEKFSLGGTNGLRGYPENALRLSSFVTGSADLLFYITQENTVYLFCNGGTGTVYEPDPETRLTYMFGYGTGISFKGNNRVNLYLEYGRRIKDKNSLGRIHIGMRMRFSPDTGSQ